VPKRSLPKLTKDEKDRVIERLEQQKAALERKLYHLGLTPPRILGSGDDSPSWSESATWMSQW
jgi:hypothetical protein